jgi:hypothetical protein
MTRLSRRAALVAAVSLAFATPAFAIYPQQSTTLVGIAFNGVVPSGTAKVDQSKLPAVPGTLTLEVRNVNLPDGTALDVEVDGTHVGTVNLLRGQGKLSTTIPYQVGRHALLDVGINGSVILTAVQPWKT